MSQPPPIPARRKPHAEVSGAQARQGLETRGGIRRYDANKTGQIFSPKER
jgi:hypothetical protein